MDQLYTFVIAPAEDYKLVTTRHATKHFRESHALPFTHIRYMN